MDKSLNDSKAAGAPSGLNVELESRFWVWWKESGWKGNSDADAAFEAWMESAKAEREACAEVAEGFEDDMGHGKAQKIADSIRMRSNAK